MNIKLYAYVMDRENQNLAQTKPLKISANINNTFKEIKEQICNEIGFPVQKQLIIFNNSTQPDQSKLEQAACFQAETCNDGKEMFLYLLTDNECRNLNQVANSTVEFVLQKRVKCRECLPYDLKIPDPKVNYVPPRQNKDPKPEEDFEKWVCGQCTFANESTNLNCIICEHAR